MGEGVKERKGEEEKGGMGETGRHRDGGMEEQRDRGIRKLHGDWIKRRIEN
jgi:hypothetical protein